MTKMRPSTKKLWPHLAWLLIPLHLAGTTFSPPAASPQREVALLVEIQTPILVGGKQVGLMKLPAGTKVSVVSGQPDGVMVSRGISASNLFPNQSESTK